MWPVCWTGLERVLACFLDILATVDGDLVGVQGWWICLHKVVDWEES